MKSNNHNCNKALKRSLSSTSTTMHNEQNKRRKTRDTLNNNTHKGNTNQTLKNIDLKLQNNGNDSNQRFTNHPPTTNDNSKSHHVLSKNDKKK